jgi:hypothetical protein
MSLTIDLIYIVEIVFKDGKKIKEKIHELDYIALKKYVTVGNLVSNDFFFPNRSGKLFNVKHESVLYISLWKKP